MGKNQRRTGAIYEQKAGAYLESGYPAEAVGRKKQQVISRCALYYMVCRGMTDVPCRFDVVSFEGDEVTVYRNAFDYIGG